MGLSQQDLLMDCVAGLSVRTSEENECFAAWVGMAAKCLMDGAEIHLLIGKGGS